MKLTTRSAGDRIVRFITDQGNGGSVFIHRNLLINSSEYLEDVVATGDYPFNDSPITVQTDISSIAMEHFSHFLYTGQAVRNGESMKKMAAVLNVYKWTYHHLRSGDFRDALVNEAIKLLTNGITSTDTHEIVRAFLDNYEEIDGGLNMLLVDWIVRSPFIGSYIYAEMNAHLSSSTSIHPIHRDLGQAFMDVKSNGEGASLTPWLEDPCQYHEHLPVTSCTPKVPVSPMAPKQRLTPQPPMPPIKRSKRKTRFSTLYQGLDDMAINEKEEIEYETPSKKPRPIHQEQWTNSERIHLLKLFLNDSTARWADRTKEHNKTFWLSSGSTFERSVGSLRQEFRKHMGANDVASTLLVVPDKIKELQQEGEPTNTPKQSILDDDSDTIAVMRPATKKADQETKDSWSEKEKIGLLTFIYENPSATDQEIADSHNGEFWAGNQERSAADVAAKYEEAVGIGRKLTTMRKIPAKLAEMKGSYNALA